MKEIRDIKIDLVMGNKNPTIDLFCEITNGLGIINCNVYNDDGMEFIYYNREGEWIFYQDCKNEKFWAHYKRYWALLEREFHLKYEEIQALTKFLVEEALKREVTTPIKFRVKLLSKVEEALKREVPTPKALSSSVTMLVEEALKRNVGTPLKSYIGSMKLVEEVLNREVSKPHFQNCRIACSKIDNKLNN
jgi:hypothetical protein